MPLQIKYFKSILLFIFDSMNSKHTWLPNGNEKLYKIQAIKINL
jgi:hypothetical protein